MGGFNQALFWSRVEKTDSCWLWRGWINKEGYGEFQSEYLVTRLAHRISYGLDNLGQIPEKPLDHLCRNRNCVRPEHLEPVDPIVNTRRSSVGMVEAAKTHCPQGHEYDETNTIKRKGKRWCRECKRQQSKEYRAKKKEEQ